MGKALPDAVLDLSPDEIATATIMTVCSAEPTNRTEAVTTFALADVTMAGVDFTVGDGDTSGRKVAVAAKSGVTVDTSGTATHIALCDATNLLAVTTCTSVALTTPGDVNIPAFDIEFRDPI